MLWVNSVSRSLSLHCVGSWFKRPVSTSLTVRSLECAQPCNNCMRLWGVIKFSKGVTFEKIWTLLCVVIVTNTLNSVTVSLMHMIVLLTRISRKMIYKHNPPQPLFTMFMYIHQIHNLLVLMKDTNLQRKIRKKKILFGCNSLFGYVICIKIVALAWD